MKVTNVPDVCTCHTSNLRCKNEKCSKLIKAREAFKKEVGNTVRSLFYNLKESGFERKECVRALRREILHKTNYGFDLFDEVAEDFWKTLCPAREH